MGFLTWLGLERKSRVGPAEDILRDLLVASNSKAGQPVTLRSAMEVTAVFACARVIAECLATVPFKVYRKDGNRRIDGSDNPVARLLGKQPNPWQTSFEFREQLGYHLALTGNAFVFKSRSVSGQLLELFAYEPGAVTVTRHSDMTLTYTLTLVDGRRIQVPAQDIWHIRGPSFNGYLGLDAVHLARNAIGLAQATEEFASKLFANGARPGGILSTEVPLTKEQSADIKASWAEAQAGGGNAMKTALLANGLKFQQLSQTADEAQFIQSRQMAIVEICRAMRVNPIMVMHNEGQAAYASVEQRFIAHHRDTLAPWFVRFETSANINIFTPEEQAEGFYTKLDGNALMRGTAKERAEFYAIMLQNGILARNEIRALEDWEPFDDPAHDLPTPAANLFGPEPAPQED